MTLQASGEISLKDLRTEYTSAAPSSSTETKLSQYYFGSTNLKKNACATAAYGDSNHPGYTPHFENIPLLKNPITDSDPIRLSQFYGKSYYYAPQTASSISGGNEQSFDPKTIESDALKSATINSAFIVLNTSETIASTRTSTPALTVGTKDRSHTTVYINNASGGRIFGKGGKGGNANNGNGAAGGDAIKSSTHLYLNNNGRVFGGGGGGSASGCAFRTFKEAYCANDSLGNVGGCGGGGGKGGGGGGNGIAGSGNCNGQFPSNGFNGSAGNSDDTGAGGAGGSGSRLVDYTVDGVAIYVNANAGGTGGGWGSAGDNAGSGTGGAAGRAVVYKSGLYYKSIKAGTIAGTNGATF